MDMDVAAPIAGRPSRLRIVWALAAKDIVDALKNKTTLSVVLSTLFIVVLYRLLPGLEAGPRPVMLLYDPIGSGLLDTLAYSQALDVRDYGSPAALEAALRRSDVPRLAISVPAGWPQEPVVDGYVVHWVSRQDALELQALAEHELSAAMGRPVRVRLAGHTVYTAKDSGGYPFVAAATLAVAVIVVGVSLVGHLILEEKQARTMDALLVSPAGSVEIVLGKAVAGLFYGLTAVAVVLAVNAPLVTHWGLALLVGAAGALFGVSCGLLLGTLASSRPQFQVLAWATILPLLFPVFLAGMAGLMPPGALAVLDWVPTVALSQAVRVAFAEEAPLADFGPELAMLLGGAAIVLAVVAWRLRHADR